MQTQVNGFRFAAVAIREATGRTNIRLDVTGTHTDKWDAKETVRGDLTGTYCVEHNLLKATVSTHKERNLFQLMHDMLEDHYGHKVDALPDMSEEMRKYVSDQDKLKAKRREWKLARAKVSFLSKDAWKALEKAVQA